MVTSAITGLGERRDHDVPPPEIEAMIKEASLVSGDEANLLYFKIASEWFTIRQWSGALEWFKKVDPARLPEAVQPDLIAYQIFMCYYSLKSRADAQTVFDFTCKNYPESRFIGAMRQLVGAIPQ